MDRKRLLLAVNAPIEIDKLRKVLVRAGYEVKITSDGVSALELARDFRPHLILSELELAKIDGHHFLREIKSRPATRSTPFIIMSRHRSVSERVHSIKLGADDYVTVPFDIREVMVRFEVILKEVDALEGKSQRNTKGFSGRLSEMNAIEILQTLEISQKSGALRIHNEEEEGLLLVKDGQIMQATLADLSARDALLRLITWDEGTFEFEIQEVHQPCQFEDSTESIVKMAMLYRDRWDGIRQKLPPLQTAVTLDQSRATGQLSPEESQVLGLVNGNSKLGHLINESPLDALKALSILARLFRKGCIKEIPFENYEDGDRRNMLNGNLSGSSNGINDVIIKFMHPTGLKATRQHARLDRRNRPDRRLKHRRWADNVKHENKIHLSRSELLIIREKLAGGHDGSSS